MHSVYCHECHVNIYKYANYLVIQSQRGPSNGLNVTKSTAVDSSMLMPWDSRRSAHNAYSIQLVTIILRDTALIYTKMIVQ